MVVVAPFALETLRIPGAIPEFRLLEMNRLRPGIKRPLDPNAKEFAVIGAGTHVIYIAPVADLVSLTICLRFILVVDSIEAAVEVILILAPGHPGHDMDAITVLAPGFNPRGQIGVYAIYDGDI